MDETQFEERVTWGDDGTGHATAIQAQNLEVTREETIETDLDQAQAAAGQGLLFLLISFQSLQRSYNCSELEWGSSDYRRVWQSAGTDYSFAID